MLKQPRFVRLVAAAVALIVAAVAGYSLWRIQSTTDQQLAAQQHVIDQLRANVDALQVRAGQEPDWSATALRVEASVVTVETSHTLGSAWVARSDARGSDLVTNYHVVASEWSAGLNKVDVRQQDRTVSGTIVRVDTIDDLAIVHVEGAMTPLLTAAVRPKLGMTVMAVGSPLGLDGSVSIGVISGYRSLDGSDYIQFSAAISPGNSGGPVVDAMGHVVAVASAKLVGEGVEALSLAIPIQLVCENLAVCRA